MHRTYKFHRVGILAFAKYVLQLLHAYLIEVNFCISLGKLDLSVYWINVFLIGDMFYG